MTADTSPASVRCGGPQRHPTVLSEDLPDGSVVLFHPVSRRLMTLNPAGSLVWELADGTRSAAAITGELQDLHPSAPSVAEDVARILRELREWGMVT